MRNLLSRTLLAPIVVLCAIWLQPAAAAVDASQAADFLTELQEKAASRLGDASISSEEREQYFRQLFNENFNVPAIGRFIIGRYWRRVSDADKQAFLKVFEDAMVQRFLSLLAKNSKERFKIGTVTPHSERDVLIHSRIDRNGAEPYRVVWRVRETDGSFKILDIVAEGVSMAITLRSEYGSVLKNNGGNLPQLTDALRDKATRGAFAQQQTN
jgi:phospholipid transport system substrate-binding protein